MHKTNGNSSFHTGVIWSLTSAFLWSTTFVCARYLMRDRVIDPVSLSLFRFLAGGILLFLFGYFFMRTKLFTLKTKDIPELAFLAVFGVVGMSVLLFFGQQTTSAINTSMIMQINPVIIFFLGLLIGEKASLMKFLGIILSLAGCLLVVDVITMRGFAYDFNHLSGDLIIFASACCWAIYSVFGKNAVKRLGGFAVTTWTMLFGALELLLLLMFLPGERTVPNTGSAWCVIIYIAIFPTAIAFFAWFEAMEKIDLSLLNVMQYLTPVFTIVLAWLILSERISLLNTVGIIFVIAGVVLIGRKREASAKTEGGLLQH
jgi:drug/metabolite transporter (DMT)-like permease